MCVLFSPPSYLYLLLKISPSPFLLLFPTFCLWIRATHSESSQCHLAMSSSLLLPACLFWFRLFFVFFESSSFYYSTYALFLCVRVCAVCLLSSPSYT